jgi:hypothetical protein
MECSTHPALQAHEVWHGEIKAQRVDVTLGEFVVHAASGGRGDVDVPIRANAFPQRDDFVVLVHKGVRVFGAEVDSSAVDGQGEHFF